MATALRELIVTVTADTAHFQREMARAERMGAQYFKTILNNAPNASAAWQRQTQAVRTHASAVKAGALAAIHYKVAMEGVKQIGTLITLADEWGQISARIRLATHSSADFALAQERLMQIANRTYRDYNEAAEQFATTAELMRDLGFATRDTLDAAESLGLALVAGGASAQQGASANDAWAKSIARGRMSMQELNTIMLQTPRLFRALMDGLGKSSEQLQQMAGKGELTAQTIVPALISQLGKLGQEADSMATTVQDAGVRFRNELRKWSGEFNQAHGATHLLVRGIETLGENINGLATVGIVAGIGLLTRKTLELAAASGAATLGAARHAIERRNETAAIAASAKASAAQAGIDLRRAQAERQYAITRQQKLAAILALTAAEKHHALATQAVAVAQTNAARAANLAAVAGRGLLGVVGGPMGIITLLGTAAASWWLLGDHTSAASNAAEHHAEVMREVNSLTRISAASARELAGEKLNEAKASATAARAVLQEAQARFEAAQQVNQMAGLRQGEGALTGAGYAEGEAARRAGAARQRLGQLTAQVVELQLTLEHLDVSATAERAAEVTAQADALTRQYEQTLANYQRQAALIGQSGQAAALAWELAHGELRTLAPAQKEALRLAADHLDQMTAAHEHQRQQEQDSERQLQRYADLATAQEREIALYGETSRAAALAYDTAHGALAGFSAAQKQALAANAEWLDFLDEMNALDEVWAGIASEHASTAQGHMEQLSSFAEQAARNMQDHFAQFLFNPFDGGLTGMLRGFSDTVRKMAAELAASRLFEMLGTALSGAGGSGWLGALGRTAGAAFTGNTGGGRAAGGPVAPHTAYEVTEHGPELLRFGSRQVLMMGAQPGIVSPLLNAPGGGAATAPAPRITVNIHGAPEGSQASASVARGNDGGLDISVLLKQIDGYIANGIAGGYGNTQAALKSRFALREAL